jgi:putative phosphoribosyl transferase
MLFANRIEAGKRLAHRLEQYRGLENAIVLALPRGGVPVASEVAAELDLPLDIFMVRKLGVPGHDEFAFGSIASGGVRYVNREVVNRLRLSPDVIDQVTRREERELERREMLYRGDEPPPDLVGRSVIVVDDGLATGATMTAAIRAIKRSDPRAIIVAVPVCAPETCRELQNNVDVWCVCVYASEPFLAVGAWYKDFDQTTDTEVRELLAKARSREPALAHFV